MGTRCIVYCQLCRPHPHPFSALPDDRQHDASDRRGRSEEAFRLGRLKHERVFVPRGDEVGASFDFLFFEHFSC